MAIRGFCTLYGGGDGGGVDIEKVKYKIEETEFLKSIYDKLSVVEKKELDIDEINTYVGIV